METTCIFAKFTAKNTCEKSASPFSSSLKNTVQEIAAHFLDKNAFTRLPKNTFAFRDTFVDISFTNPMKKTQTRCLTTPSHPRGFTLVELLVVIAILAVLATLIVAGAQKVKQKAYEATALNGIRQISSANMSYSMENFGDINVLLDAADPRNAAGYVSKNYWGRLTPYLFDEITTTNEAQISSQIKVKLAGLFATSDLSKMTKTFQQGSGIYHDESGIAVPFAFSNSVYQWNKYIKTSAFPDPSLTLYITYGFYRFDQEDGKAYAELTKKGAKRTNNIDYFPSKKAVFTFLDGHVEMLSPPINARYFPQVPQ
jgi:prepilin-type N-terminal cleavage/methylation domain-containing protein/prepilin-type processing-associated H-X9-DG protein